jgi:hypothetical protein
MRGPVRSPSAAGPGTNASISASQATSRRPWVISFGTLAENRKPGGTDAAQRWYVAIRCSR